MKSVIKHSVEIKATLRMFRKDTTARALMVNDAEHLKIC
jgi:hypothetical protein